MTPILFSENSTTFTTNGIGRLSDAISCVVTEERNGQYELEMEYPIDGQHYSDIAIRSIIAAVPCDGGNIQAFRVYKISKPISGRVAIYARHISYDLGKNTAMPFTVAASPGACASALAGLKSHAVESCPFTFWTNVTTAGSYIQATPASIRSRLGGTEGSVLDQFGGEYEWDNFSVKLHRQRGTLAANNGITLRYGKNITDITQEENIADTATGVVPYWTDIDGNIVTLPEKAVYSPNASRYSQKLTVPLDLSDNWEEAPSVAELRAAAQVVVNASAFGVPKVSIEVSFIALWQTEEYKDIVPLQRVRLCDEVTVSFERLGVDAVAKVVKTEYDVLAERYRSIQIGSIRSNLATTLNDQTAQTLKEIEAQAVSASQAINNATKWLTSAGGYVIAIKNTDGTWKELIFSNKTDPYASDAKILRVNNNGIGFSLNGMGGTFTNAWTIDGHLVADFLFGGTLTLGGRGTKYDGSGTVDNNRGWLKLLNSSNQQIGKWDMNGIEVKTGVIAGPTVKAGGTNNASGLLQILNASNAEIGRWDASGINVKAGQLNINNAFKVDTAGKLTATGADIGGKVTISSGSMNINNAFKVDTAGKLTATGADIGGKVTVSSGSMNINNKFIVSEQGAVDIKSGTLNINNAFQVNTQGKLTATDADISGKITATSGQIGNFTITQNNGMYNGKSGRDDSSNGVYVGTNGIALGANSKFKVDENGNLNATAANIQGKFNNQAQDGGSVNMDGGVLTVHNAGGASGYIRLELGSEVVIMNEHRVSWTDGSTYMSAKWSDIIDAFKS